MGTATFVRDTNSMGAVGKVLLPTEASTHKIHFSFGTVTMSNSYATGGDTVATPADVEKILHVFLAPQAIGYHFVYNQTTNKIQATVADVEVTATTDLSAQKVDALFIGVKT